jgi:hypothetical protein
MRTKNTTPLQWGYVNNMPTNNKWQSVKNQTTDGNVQPPPAVAPPPSVVPFNFFAFGQLDSTIIESSPKQHFWVYL